MIHIQPRQKTHYVSLCILVAIAGGLFLITQKINQIESDTSLLVLKTASMPIPKNFSNKPQAVIGNTRIFLEVAQTSAEIQKGLSGRSSLDQQNGMLFMFPKPALYRFWMPNMHFPLDMIWIRDGKVVDISANVSEVFDKEHPAFYTPKVPARYVLEVNAGFSSRHGIRIGDAVIFKNISKK